MFCLQLLWKEVADPGIRELLAPLNLEPQQPVEKVSGWAACPGVPTSAQRRPRASAGGGACGCCDPKLWVRDLADRQQGCLYHKGTGARGPRHAC